jgi:hypothetical protein
MRLIVGVLILAQISIIFGLAAQAQFITSSSSGKIPLTVVGSLPTCNAGTEGTLYGVTDALTPVALATAVGGGAIHTLVYCNGTNWIVG